MVGDLAQFSEPGGGHPDSVHVLVLESNVFLQTALVRTLEESGVARRAVATTDPDDAVRQVAAEAPELVIFDVVYDGSPRLDLPRLLRSHTQQARLLLLTDHADMVELIRCFTLGVDGYLRKRTLYPELLLDVVRALLHHPVLVADRSIGTQGAPSILRGVHALHRGRQVSLTTRERALLRALADGTTARSAAGQLGLSERTVERVLQTIRDKTGARSAFDLGALAERFGFLGPP